MRLITKYLILSEYMSGAHAIQVKNALDFIMRYARSLFSTIRFHIVFAA